MEYFHFNAIAGIPSLGLIIYIYNYFSDAHPLKYQNI